MCQNNENQIVHLWHGAEKISVTFIEHLEGDICKIANIKNKVFVLTTMKNVYYGEFDSDTITFKKTDFFAIDIAANSKNLYIVNNLGHVNIVDSNLKIVNTITLRDECENCKQR